MAPSEDRISKPSKWFTNKAHKLSFRGLRGTKSRSTVSSPASPLSPRTPRINEEDQLRQVFRYFDGDGDGKISAVELRSYFGSVGEYMSQEEAQEVIDELDEDGDSLVDFEDFLKLMKKEAQEEEDLKNAFEMFELEKGCITPKSLQRMLCRLGDIKSYGECVAMIQAFDTDGNGVVDFNEFHQMMVA